MRELKTINEFDSFDGMDEPNSVIAAPEQQGNDVDTESNYNPDSDNSIVRTLMKDYNLQDINLLSGLMSRFFPSYNNDLPISENVNRIYSNLKAQKEAGQELSNFEKTFMSIMARAKSEIAIVRENQTKAAIIENLPLLLIAALVLFYIGKRMSK